jgi:S-adenosyl methyltransferase
VTELPVDPADSPEIDTDSPHPARIYDYWIGGKNHFAADRETAEKVAAHIPAVRTMARENRMFLGRAVRFLVTEAGVRQFLDIGTGLPTTENVHEIAQRIAPASRVVYADNDPLVLAHARALLTSSPEGRTAYIHADFRDADALLSDSAVRDTLDFSQPVALILVALLHFIPDSDDPGGIIARLLGALPPGSYLVASHVTAEHDTERFAAVRGDYRVPGVTATHRDSGDFARLAFAGLDLVPPGVTLVSEWRPDDDGPRPLPAEVSCYGGVARKPAVLVLAVLVLAGGTAREVEEIVEDVTHAGQGDREMALPRLQVDPGAGDMGGEPLAVRIGDHPVLVALPDGDRCGHVGGFKSPVGRERQVVVPPAGDAVAQRGAQARRDVRGVLTGERLLVDVRDQAAERDRDVVHRHLAERDRLGLQVRGERVRSLERGTELDDVLRSHPGEEVQALGPVGGDSGDRRGGEAAAGQLRGAGERVRAAARDAVGDERVRAEFVEHRRDVAGDVAHRPARAGGGRLVTGSGDHDDPQPPGPRGSHRRRVHDEAARGPLVDHQREPVVWSRQQDMQVPAVR